MKRIAILIASLSLYGCFSQSNDPFDADLPPDQALSTQVGAAFGEQLLGRGFAQLAISCVSDPEHDLGGEKVRVEYTFNDLMDQRRVLEYPTSDCTLGTALTMYRVDPQYSPVRLEVHAREHYNLPTISPYLTDMIADYDKFETNKRDHL
jgi:hypothetical protein